ncbi:MAG: TolC family protein [Ignavibacteriae bacterium]|nr:TolC family protein [Ignavibacteriota bacterium]
MRKLSYIIIIFILAVQILPAEKVTLSECYKSVIKYYPAAKQLEYQKTISDLKIRNLNSKYYPDMNLIGQATYQSDVTKLDFPNLIFKFPEQYKDQYKIGINVDQLIWDGGIISNSKDVEYVQSAASLKKIESDLYNLKQKINEIYFSILILKIKINQLEITKNDLTEKLNTIKVRINNGILLQSNADILEAEILKLQQTEDDLTTNVSNMIGTLNILTNSSYSTDDEFEIPEITNNQYSDSSKLRLEYEMFELNRKSLDAVQGLNDAKLYPKISIFGQGMYGRPGFNIFEPDFQTFYIVGIKASWNIWNWNTGERDNEILKIQKDILTSQEDQFSLNLSIAIHSQINDIDKLGRTIEKDKQIIDLRQKIVAQASSQFDNGVITAIEYVSEVNSKSIAEQSLEIHKIELIQAKINYLTLIGKM